MSTTVSECVAFLNGMSTGSMQYSYSSIGVPGQPGITPVSSSSYQQINPSLQSESQSLFIIGEEEVRNVVAAFHKDDWTNMSGIQSLTNHLHIYQEGQFP